MVEIIEAGSPDSGYMSHSPRLDRSYADIAELKIANTSDKNFKESRAVSTPAINNDYIRGYDENESEYGLSRVGNDDGNAQSCCGDDLQTGSSIKHTDGDKLLSTSKRNGRRRKHGNRVVDQEEENASPVLGASADKITSLFKGYLRCVALLCDLFLSSDYRRRLLLWNARIEKE